MQDKLKITEIDRRPQSERNESNRIREESAVFDRRLRASLADRRRAWEQGFIAGLEAGTIRQVRGTRDIDPADEPTAPYPIIDLDLIIVD